MYCLNQRVFYKQEENDNETVGKCSCTGTSLVYCPAPYAAMMLC